MSEFFPDLLRGGIAFTKKYDGELIYEVEKGVFRVRLLV